MLINQLLLPFSGRLVLPPPDEASRQYVDENFLLLCSKRISICSLCQDFQRNTNEIQYWFSVLPECEKKNMILHTVYLVAVIIMKEISKLCLLLH